MSFIATSMQAFEGAPLPDVMRRAAIQFLVAGARRKAAGCGLEAGAAFAWQMRTRCSST